MLLVVCWAMKSMFLLGDKVYVPSTVRTCTKIMGTIIEIDPNDKLDCPYYVETFEGYSFYPKDELELTNSIYSHPLEEEA